MKKMKKVILTALVVAGLSLTSCGSDDNGGGAEASIVGKWNPTKTVTKVGNNSETLNYEENEPGCEKDYFEFIGTNSGTLRDIIYIDGQTGCQEDEGILGAWTKANDELTITGGDLEGEYEVTRLTGSDLVISDVFNQSGQEISITYHFKKAAN